MKIKRKTKMGDSVVRYNQIPDYIFNGNILEIGARDGEAQLMSRHADLLKTKSADRTYVGIDILKPPKSELNLLQCDFFKMGGSNRFDAIFALEVIEHLCLRDWHQFFNIIKRLLKPNGCLFLSTPYNESMARTLAWYLPSYADEPMGGHVVYGITPTVIRCFLKDAKCIKYKHRIHWRTDGASWLWAFFRTLKRILTFHPYAWGWRATHASLFVLWKKGEE
jgi:2-polyprenyl-3-methyl-5-hydroxy-6-metoxy-1,4-benzoquinol methylase